MSVLLLAVGLAMDAFSVATVTGFSFKKLSLRQASKVSLSFGVFHVFMPVVGWLAGSTIVLLVSSYDHWAAFLLLAFVGGKMIYDAFGKHEASKSLRVVDNLNVLLFSVAVSIDAVAVGLSLYSEDVYILLPALAFGTVTFLLSLGGALLGSRTGRLMGRGTQALGGAILIAIGLRIVFTHIYNLHP